MPQYRWQKAHQELHSNLIFLKLFFGFLSHYSLVLFFWMCYNRCPTKFNHSYLLNSLLQSVPLMYFSYHYYVNGLQILMSFPDLFKYVPVSTTYLLTISVWLNGHSKLLYPKEGSSSLSAIIQVLLLTHLLHLMAPSHCKSLCIINFSVFSFTYHLPPSPTNFHPSICF